MATTPSKPGSDGGTAVGTLTDYADWSFTGTDEDPVEPDPTTTTTATAAAAGARAAAPAAGLQPGGPRDWAEWVARKLAQELRQRANDPATPEARRAALLRALDRVKDWR